MRLFTFYDPGTDSGGTTTTTDTSSTSAGSSTTNSPSQVGSGDISGGGLGENGEAQSGKVGSEVTDRVSSSESIFDFDKWDRKDDSLPDPYKSFANKYRSIIDEEYKPKISDYETRLASYKGLPDKTAYDALDKDLKLYKALAEGAEDPRLKESLGRIEKLSSSYEAERLKNKKLQEAVEQFEFEREQAHFRQFAERHKNILSDPEKKKSLISLVESGMQEEAAAQLVSQPENIIKEVRALIAERELPESSHELAVEIVLGRHGIGAGRSSDDSPSAILTNGADGSYSSRSGYKNTDIRGLPLDQAREAATRAALKVVK